MIRKKIGLFSIVAFLFFIAGITSVQVVASADTEPDIVDVDRVVLDITCDAETTQNEQYDVILPYGSPVTVTARLDDNDETNEKSLYDNVYLYYQWYYRTDENKQWSALEKKTTLTNVKQTLSQVDESGSYKISVTAIQYGDKKITVSLDATVSVLIEPRVLTITYGDNNFTYNGKHQDIQYTVSGALEGENPLCFPDYSDSPSNAGTYTVTFRCYNSNYKIDGETVTTYTIQKAPLTVKVEDVIIPADTYYSIQISYSGFCGEDTAESLEYVPKMPDECYEYRSVGSYVISADGPLTDKNYEITYVSGHVYVSPSTLSGNQAVGFNGKAVGFFSPDSVITLEQKASPVSMSTVASYAVHLSGTSYNETYTLTINDVDLSGALILNMCYVSASGEKQKLESYSYNRTDKILTVTLKTPTDGTPQTDGYIVVYHNWWWIIIPAVILVIIIFSIIIFHVKDRRKFKLAHLIYGSAKFEADKYRKMIGEVVEEDESHIDYQ